MKRKILPVIILALLAGVSFAIGAHSAVFADTAFIFSSDTASAATHSSTANQTGVLTSAIDGIAMEMKRVALTIPDENTDAHVVGVSLTTDAALSATTQDSVLAFEYHYSGDAYPQLFTIRLMGKNDEIYTVKAADDSDYFYNVSFGGTMTALSVKNADYSGDYQAGNNVAASAKWLKLSTAATQHRTIALKLSSFVDKNGVTALAAAETIKAVQFVVPLRAANSIAARFSFGSVALGVLTDGAATKLSPIFTAVAVDGVKTDKFSLLYDSTLITAETIDTYARASCLFAGEYKLFSGSSYYVVSYPYNAGMVNEVGKADVTDKAGIAVKIKNLDSKAGYFEIAIYDSRTTNYWTSRRYKANLNFPANSYGYYYLPFSSFAKTNDAAMNPFDNGATVHNEIIFNMKNDSSVNSVNYIVEEVSVVSDTPSFIYTDVIGGVITVDSIVKKGETVNAVFAGNDNYILAQAELNGEDISGDIDSDGSYTFAATADSYNLKVVYTESNPITIGKNATFGSILSASDVVEMGRSATVQFVGYRGGALISATFNGADIMDKVDENGYYSFTADTDTISIVAVFEDVREFAFDMDDRYFNATATRGTFASDFDAISYQGSSVANDIDAGITAKGISYTVTDGGYLAITTQIPLPCNAALTIALKNSAGTEFFVAGGSQYYTVNNFGVVTAMAAESNGQLYTLSKTTSMLYDVYFCGVVYIPVSAFDGLDNIAQISVYASMAEYPTLKLNIGEIYVCDFDGQSENTPAVIWDPALAEADTGYSLYFKDNTTDNISAQTHCMVVKLAAGGFYFDERFNEYVSSGFTYGGFDCLNVKFPEVLRASNGNINISGLSGMMFDVENLTTKKILYSFAFWEANAAGSPIKWASNANAKVLFIAKDGSCYWDTLEYIPAGFSGSIYVPFIFDTVNGVEATFTGGSVFGGDINATRYAAYDGMTWYWAARTNTSGAINLTNIKMIADIDDYVMSITMAGAHVKMYPEAVRSSGNVTFTFTPDEGYEVMKVVLGVNTLTANAEGKYIVEVYEGMSFTVDTSAITYNIAYNLNGGTNNSENPDTFTIETFAFNIHAPTKEGATFDGWYKNSSFTGQKVEYIANGTVGDIELYAKWLENDDGGKKDGCKSSAGVSSVILMLLAVAFIAGRKRID